MGCCVRLVDRLFKLIDPGCIFKRSATLPTAKRRSKGVASGRTDEQFLQIAVRYVVAAPIWYSIKLDAMRELHVSTAIRVLEATLRPGCTPKLGRVCCKRWESASLLELAKLYGRMRGE